MQKQRIVTLEMQIIGYLVQQSQQHILHSSEQGLLSCFFSQLGVKTLTHGESGLTENLAEPLVQLETHVGFLNKWPSSRAPKVPVKSYSQIART